MRAAGLDAELGYESYPLAFSARKRQRTVRGRCMPLLSHFDDTRREARIAEIRQASQGSRAEFDGILAFIPRTAA
jgi:hypothetical protein